MYSFVPNTTMLLIFGVITTSSMVTTPVAGSVVEIPKYLIPSFLSCSDVL